MSSSPTPEMSAQRLGRLVRAPWFLAALMTLLCCADVVLLVKRGGTGPVAAPGAALLALLAVRGRRHPVVCSAAAAAVLLLSSAMIRIAGAEPHSAGLGTILPTENVAGMLLVLFAHRRLSPLKALPVTAGLVLACFGAMYLRGVQDSPGQIVALGVLQLLLAVGTGTYLRGWQLSAASTPLRELFRRQWPMIAGLSVLLFVDAGSTFDGSVSGLVVLLGSLVLAALAVIAPLRPVEVALLAATATLCAGVAARLIGQESPYNGLLEVVPVSSVAAGMLVLAYLVRYASSRRALLAGAALTGAALVAAILIPGGPFAGSGGGALQALMLGGLLLALAVGSGLYFRARDGERSRTVNTAVEQAQQAERLALARELHDVVAHHVTGIVVQAQAAQLVAAQKPEAAVEAMERIAGSGTEALVAMRRLVASMRGAEPAGTSGATEQATTDLAADLTALAEGAGPKVSLRLELDREVPQEVARSALRLVQESVTNAGKHAPDATAIRVVVRSPQEHLHIRVTDDGSGQRAAPAGGSGGYGLVGMRERIELLGGRFSAGPVPDAGWRVEAWLPLAEREAG
ncbi:histidine kinase [Saccharopolyspora sp. NPDC047091]|uniref:sensor histidine kinase n=1 Tax=Saccharopolyspora sp. NPDC047091 TaxID=3155924 RepID=UPI0033FD9AF5